PKCRQRVFHMDVPGQRIGHIRILVDVAKADHEISLAAQVRRMEEVVERGFVLERLRGEIFDEGAQGRDETAFAGEIAERERADHGEDAIDDEVIAHDPGRLVRAEDVPGLEIEPYADVLQSGQELADVAGALTVTEVDVARPTMIETDHEVLLMRAEQQ